MSARRSRRRTAALLASATLAATVAGAAPAGAAEGLGYEPATTKGSLFHIAATVGAHDSYRAGFTGRGIGVALVDTGVTEVPGLDTGNVLHGPDLSFDSQDPELAHRDAYGHGTHLASIIAGRDVAGFPKTYLDHSRFTGIAPDARLVSVKVGASDGAVDVSQVIAGINWVVEHKDDPGLNIRVLNLSYGTDSLQDHEVDPLAYAVENAWRNGIVVVTAGGNDGSETYQLANPALDPHVLAVGAADTQGTTDPADDLVPAWASRGTDKRHMDVVAPGVSVLGLRVPNGHADERHPDARVGTRFAKASGTSQAAAVVSGEVALLLQRYPRATPDDVKAQILASARSFEGADKKHRGKGLTHVGDAQVKSLQKGKWNGLPYSTGTGSLEAARGTSHVHDGVAELRGEIDIFGNPWDPAAFAARVTDGTIWDAGRWRGTTWTGDGWTGRTWRDVTWSDAGWSGRTWRDSDWTGRTWRDGAWEGRTWREGDWTGRTWRDANWSGRTWRSADLASANWS